MIMGGTARTANALLTGVLVLAIVAVIVGSGQTTTLLEGVSKMLSGLIGTITAGKNPS